MSDRVVIYPSTIEGLSRYLSKRFALDEALVHRMMLAAFHDFIGPMVMDHGAKFRITNFGTFVRFWAISRYNGLTGKSSVAHYVMKFKASRRGGYAK